MGKNDTQILILEDDVCFRGILETLCATMGQTTAVADADSALKLMTKESYNLLLLDWHLTQPDPSALYSTLENFQPNAYRIDLFTVPDLSHVIASMKSGACDILWPGQTQETLKVKIKEALSLSKPPVIAHAYVSRLAESLTEKALVQKTSFFQARREFSRSFLQQILHQQNLRRTQLASLMNVSPRTLQRHLSA